MIFCLSHLIAQELQALQSHARCLCVGNASSTVGNKFLHQEILDPPLLKHINDRVTFVNRSKPHPSSKSVSSFVKGALT